MTADPARPRGGAPQPLKYPQSVAIFDSYPAAAAAVHHLASQQFPVENLAIVGTDLRSVERVLARKTWASVLIRGIIQGLVTGTLLAAVLWLFMPSGSSRLQVVGTALGIGLVVSTGLAALAYVGQGRRDFSSARQIIATRYEVLCEHTVADRARELLARSVS